MKLTEEAVMHIAGRIEVGMALVVASGARKEFAPFACDPLACLVREPHAFTATTRTILRSAMGIDFHTHHANGIGFFFRELIDFSSQLIGLFAIEPP
jgi:hypothetical protein